MTQILPWLLVIGLLAGLALVVRAARQWSGERGAPVRPLLQASAILGAVWLVVSAICWHLLR